MAAGGILLVGGGLLALVRAIRNKQKPAPTPFRPTVDALLATATKATDATLAARQVQDRLKVNAVVQAVSAGMLAVVGAAITLPGVMSAVMSALGTVVSTVFETALTSFLGVFAIVLIAIIVTMNILAGIKATLTRFQAVMYAFGGDYTSVNQWELGTMKSWLDQMGVKYNVVNVTPDVDMKVTRTLSDGSKHDFFPYRYAITNVQMDPAKWSALQAVLRLSAIDYYKRVGKIMSTARMRWSNRYSGPEFASIPNVAPAWVESADPVQKRIIRDYLWDTFPAISDAKARPTDSDKATATVAQLAGLTYSGMLAMSMQSPTFLQCMKNNHFAAIMAGVALTRYDEWEPNPPANPAAYAQVLCTRLGLTADDHVVPYEQYLVFDKAFWGRKIVVDVTGVKAGAAGSIAMYDENDRLLDQGKFNPK